MTERFEQYLLWWLIKFPSKAAMIPMETKLSKHQINLRSF